MLEKHYSTKIKRFVEKRGGMFLVNTASIHDKAGRSDVEILYKGHIIFAELKTNGYEPTNLQITFLRHVREQGLIGVILEDDLTELTSIFHLIDTGHISEYEQPKLPPLKKVDLFDEEEAK